MGIKAFFKQGTNRAKGWLVVQSERKPEPESSPHESGVTCINCGKTFAQLHSPCPSCKQSMEDKIRIKTPESLQAQPPDDAEPPPTDEADPAAGQPVEMPSAADLPLAASEPPAPAAEPSP